jgi:hypothetical protein
MKRKLARGQPLNEVKGSLDYQMAQIRRDFRAQFPAQEEWYPWIHEIFADYVIVTAEDLAPDEFYYVPYASEGERYIFAAQEDWEVVELAYVPSSAPDVSESAGRQRFVETAGYVELDEAEADPEGPWPIRGIGITAGVVNANGRRYAPGILRAAVEEVQTHLHESAGQGRLKESLTLTGEPDHPSDKGHRGPRTLETVINWTGVQFDGTHVLLEGLLLGTGAGRDIRAQMKGGVMPGISQRAYGESRIVEEDGHKVEEVLWVTITGYDLTAPNQQSDPEAGVTFFESRQEPAAGGEGAEEMKLEELREKYPHLVRQIEEEHDARKREELEQALAQRAAEDAERERLLVEHDQELRELLGLNETADITEAMRTQAEELKRLRDEARQRKVQAYIESQVEDLPYADFMKSQFVEAIQGAEPQTIDEAKRVISAKRREYDALQAELTLKQRGFGVHVQGPVIESELGIPAHARAGWAIQESMDRHTGKRWDHQQPVTRAQIFAARYLEHYDVMYSAQLARESALFEEAEITTDLNLPYSVSRAVVAEAIPMLIAADVFTFGVTDRSPFRMYYEAFSGDTGYSGSVSDEDVTADLDAWVSLDYKRVTPGTVVVTSDGGGTTYVEGTDYVVDYAGGQLKALSAGDISDGASLDVDYSYTAIRKGEMAAIERGEINLTYKTMTAAADRLAQQISDEAVQFSRSQLNWDATQRTLASLVERIRRLIDQGVLYMALSAALSVANNIAGTWTSATDSLDLLVKYIGQAGVKVWNRYYEPTAVVTSRTNADLISNWDGFKRDGFPDAILRSNGFVGRVKGYPVYASSEFSDSYLLVANRELAMHWVYRPLVIKGPYPTYDVSGGTTKLKAADQYYAEEYNVTDAPVAEKGALVKIS